MWVESQKYHLHIELTSKCNSACPNCPRFIKGTPVLASNIELSEIKLKDIKKWFDVDFTTDFEQDTNTINASNELD